MRFVLVHGALHGAWCWEKLVPELEALGHFAVTVDLPGGGQRVGEVASLDGWRDAIVDVLEDRCARRSFSRLLGRHVGGRRCVVREKGGVTRSERAVWVASERAAHQLRSVERRGTNL